MVPAKTKPALQQGDSQFKHHIIPLKMLTFRCGFQEYIYLCLYGHA